MTRIGFHLYKKWFDMVWDGKKTVEYREIKPYWTERFAKAGNDFDIVFQSGYKKGGRRVFAKAYKVDIGPCPYEGWGGNWYRVHFVVTGKSE